MKVVKENPIVKLFVHSSHYLTGTVVVMLAGFISLPILTRLFSKSEYGLLSLVSITLWLGLAFSKAGLQESAVRFYSEFRSGKRKEDISVFYTTLLISALIIALLVSAILWSGVHIFSISLFGAKTADLMRIVVIMIVTGTVLTIMNNYYRAAQSTKAFNLVNIIRRYFRLAVGISLLFAISKNVTTYFSGFILSEVILIIILGCILFYKKARFKFRSYSWSFFNECLIFGFPLIINEVAGYLLKTTDRYIIQLFLGSGAVGIYSLGSDLCLYVKDMIAHPLFYAIVPIYLELWNNKGADKTKEFISKVSYYYSIIAIPIMFGFIALAKPIVAIVASAKFAESSSIIPYILPGTIIWGYYPIATAGLYIHKKTKKLSMMIFLGIGINIGLNLFLIPRLQLQGAALATLITYAILTGLLTKFSFQYLKTSIDIAALIKVCLSSAIMFFAIKSINIGTGIISILFLVLFGAILYCCLMILIDKNFRRMVFNTINTQRSRYAKMDTKVDDRYDGKEK